MATLSKLSRCLLQLRFLSGARRALCGLAVSWMLVGTLCFSASHGQTVATDSALTVEEVVKLRRAGLSEELIVAKIKKNGKAFDLNSDELVELKKQGLSDNLIHILMDPSQPYTPPVPVVQGKKYPNDPFAALVPTDAGLYFFSGAAPPAPAKTDLKVVLGMRKGKMLKGKPIAYLAGGAAKLRVKAGKPVFYLRLPEGKEISDLILTSLLEKDDRRELSSLPGPKGGFNPDDVLPFDQLEVGAKLFKLTPAPMDEGEYIFFLVGSAEPDKGTYGKGYDFGADPAPVQKKK
jgi:hypothetical protein